MLAVLIARDIVDLGAPDYSLQDLLDEWGESSFDLERDAIVCEAGEGEIVAYASVRRPAGYAAVAPGHEGRGIGHSLLSWSEQRQRELGWERHRHAAAARNSRARGLLTGAGYGLVRSYFRLCRPLGDVPIIPVVPAGIRMRAPRPRADAEVLHALDAAAFSQSADYQEMSLEEFAERHLAAHDVEPSLSCVAVREDRVAGFLLSRRWDQESAGYVDLLAVHPDQQRRGVGSALLLTAFERYRAAGLSEARLGVASDNPGALALYTRLGMRETFRIDIYERALG